MLLAFRIIVQRARTLRHGCGTAAQGRAGLELGEVDIALSFIAFVSIAAHLRSAFATQSFGCRPHVRIQAAVGASERETKRERAKQRASGCGQWVALPEAVVSSSVAWIGSMTDGSWSVRRQVLGWVADGVCMGLLRLLGGEWSFNHAPTQTSAEHGTLPIPGRRCYHMCDQKA